MEEYSRQVTCTSCCQTNAGRIAFLAADAKRLYNPFSKDNIPESLLVPGVFVAVDPADPVRSGNVYNIPPVVENVVLRSKNNKEAVARPEKFETEPVMWSNLLGGKVESNRALAMFTPTAIAELPAGDVDVVVVTKAGERSCKIDAAARARVLKPQS